MAYDSVNQLITSNFAASQGVDLGSLVNRRVFL